MAYEVAELLPLDRELKEGLHPLRGDRGGVAELLPLDRELKAA